MNHSWTPSKAKQHSTLMSLPGDLVEHLGQRGIKQCVILTPKQSEPLRKGSPRQRMNAHKSISSKELLPELSPFQKTATSLAYAPSFRYLGWLNSNIPALPQEIFSQLRRHKEVKWHDQGHRGNEWQDKTPDSSPTPPKFHQLLKLLEHCAYRNQQEFQWFKDQAQT